MSALTDAIATAFGPVGVIAKRELGAPSDAAIATFNQIKAGWQVLRDWGAVPPNPGEKPALSWIFHPDVLAAVSPQYLSWQQFRTDWEERDVQDTTALQAQAQDLSVAENIASDFGFPDAYHNRSSSSSPGYGTTHPIHSPDVSEQTPALAAANAADVASVAVGKVLTDVQRLGGLGVLGMLGSGNQQTALTKPIPWYVKVGLVTAIGAVGYGAFRVFTSGLPIGGATKTAAKRAPAALRKATTITIAGSDDDSPEAFLKKHPKDGHCDSNGFCWTDEAEARQKAADAKAKAACEPGGSLPSWYLWDSNASLLNYVRTADYFSVCDFPPGPDDAHDNGVLTARKILHTVPRAVFISYPFAARDDNPFGDPTSHDPSQPSPPPRGWHFAIREKTESLPNDPADQAPVDANAIAQQVGISPADVPLAMFAGLIHEEIDATSDSSKILSEAVDMIKNAFTDAMSGNLVGVAGDIMADIGTYTAPRAAIDQNMYNIQVKGRKFTPAVGGGGFTTALSAVKAAHQKGASIADALRSVAAKGIEPGYFNMLAKLHEDNEARATAMVNDPAFAGWAQTQANSDPAGLRKDMLLKAGAAVTGGKSPFAHSQVLFADYAQRQKRKKTLEVVAGVGAAGAVAVGIAKLLF